MSLRRVVANVTPFPLLVVYVCAHCTRQTGLGFRQRFGKLNRAAGIGLQGSAASCSLQHAMTDDLAASSPKRETSKLPPLALPSNISQPRRWTTTKPTLTSKHISHSLGTNHGSSWNCKASPKSAFNRPQCPSWSVSLSWTLG